MVDELLISEAFEIYRVEYIVYLNQSDRTEEMSLCAMNSLIAFTGNIPISQLTFDQVRKWKTKLEKTMSQNTVRGYIIKLRVVLKHLSRRGYTNILNHEMVGVPKRADKVASFLELYEINQLLELSFEPAAGYRTINRYRNRAMIKLLFSSGLRVSEMCKLDRDSIRVDNTFTIIGKGGKARLCFLDKTAMQYINEYLLLREDNNKALFLSELTNERISVGTVQGVFRNLKKKSGIIKPITPHTMRHSFATDLLRNNTNIVYVKEFLGHSNIQTTEMYMHVVNEDLRAIYNEKHTV